MKDTIRQLSRRLGISTDTIRHYRELGLLHPAIRENGYAAYSSDDLLRILVTREMRSMDIPLPQVQQLLHHQTMSGYCDWLHEREEALDRRIQYLQLEMQRLQETRAYASCGMKLYGSVEEFDGPSTWAVGAMDTKSPHTRGDVLAKWIDRFPFTYVSATITLDDLLHTQGDTPYTVSMGVGSLEKYVNTFSLPLPEYAHFQPGGHFIRTCIVT
ncbi:MAG: MerR family transcriptional regulator, partial [Eubacteriales bacterium]|nr:MerR family transcriptional regulator [Eubacteriales bacterium]